MITKLKNYLNKIKEIYLNYNKKNDVDLELEFIFIKKEFKKFLQEKSISFNESVPIQKILDRCVITVFYPQIKSYYYYCKYTEGKISFTELDEFCILIYFNSPTQEPALIGKIFADENTYKKYKEI